MTLTVVPADRTTATAAAAAAAAASTVRRRADPTPIDLPSIDIVQPWVAAAPFRAHVRHVLRGSGLPWRALAVAAQVEPTVVRTLLHGRSGRPVKRLHPGSARRLLAVDAVTLAERRLTHVAAAPVVEQLRAATAAGVDLPTMAGWLRLSPSEVSVLLSGSATHCNGLTALLAEALTGACGAEVLAA